MASRKWHILLPLFFLLIICVPELAWAQDNYSKEFGFSAGFSPGSTHGIGVTSGQQLFQASVDFGFVLKKWDNALFKYKVSLIPVAFVHGDTATLNLRPHRTVYGGGADPIGLQFNFRTRKAFQPFVGATGGFLYFTEQVPVTNSSQYNFTFSLGAGGEYMLGRHSILFGYRYHHLSNGYTAQFNPGIDSHILWAGFSFKR